MLTRVYTKTKALLLPTQGDMEGGMSFLNLPFQSAIFNMLFWEPTELDLSSSPVTCKFFSY